MFLGLGFGVQVRGPAKKMTSRTEPNLQLKFNKLASSLPVIATPPIFLEKKWGKMGKGPELEYPWSSGLHPRPPSSLRLMYDAVPRIPTSARLISERDKGVAVHLQILPRFLPEF